MNLSFGGNICSERAGEMKLRYGMRFWVNNGSLFKKLVPDIRALITDDQYARWLLM
jgi:hypothetical protein